jgi:flavin reductase (DIM6/NTAB) family NADH-FMN oxidoreductase RutF
MYLSKQAIKDTERIKRLNIINSLPGIKPANLIGTISKDNNTNLAIISSVFHLGSNPALMGFISRPGGEVRRHTYENILETRYYTINQVHLPFFKNAHYTSAKFEVEESEFEKCHLTEEYCYNFMAPFVKESKLKMGMKLVETIPVKMNDTILIIGEIEHLIIPDEAFDEKGYIDLEETGAVGISGLNTYYQLHKIGSLPYARVNELPDFD